MKCSLGTLLREFRIARGMSQASLASRSGVSRVTLARWESGASRPRLPELAAAFDVLQASDIQREEALALIGATRAIEALRKDRALVLPEEVIAPPAGGDLLRALRHRRRLSLEQVAHALDVTHSTVSRWERSETAPPPGRLPVLFEVLGARPEEQAALSSDRLLHSPFPLPIGPPDFEEMADVCGRLWELNHCHPEDPLLDLKHLAVQAEMWRYAVRFPRARQLLAEEHVLYASYLLGRTRVREAGKQAYRALQLYEQEFAPDKHWIYAIETVSQEAAYGATRPAPLRGAEIIERWISVTEAMDPGDARLMRAFLERIQANYLCKAGETGQAMDLLRRAQKTLEGGPWGPDELYHNQWQEGEVHLKAGRPHEAASIWSRLHLNWLSPGDTVHEQMRWTEALLALGQVSEAHDRLGAALALIEEHDLESARSWARDLVARVNERERGFRLGRVLAEQTLRLRCEARAAVQHVGAVGSVGGAL